MNYEPVLTSNDLEPSLTSNTTVETVRVGLDHARHPIVVVRLRRILQFYARRI